ncbi:23S rRNA (guanosine(2251)-2'-O)-methyltransferase RlmB [Zobellella taiwanensis]|jgi:23S rRNA (guanosine2251-2'-O)-methyltransferase|uniref:23S rRNA (guanosine-2'-O-)-methyltransferase RlmB n=1 Tax=Zobellella taiwanensis TaxID=347535 RepID=A0A2P7QMU4_9GAMM|nr:23S rRNA (guanosine(2251)-2'-O)-methyltransferase RlmB [Zobellella taiwanensis]PSJ39290.1 23S rRNA (guanosine(2251)-2'-O)-methyltransferase RlmB [Zobellella taiwanensis]
MSSELIFGIHALDAVLESHPEHILEVWLLKGRDDARLQGLQGRLQAAGVKVQFAGRQTLDGKADGHQHQGVVARVKAQPALNEADLDALLGSLTAPLLLVLDGVTDPHNLGACLRTADAAGVHGVIVPRDKSAGLTPVARKVACGAAEVVPLFQVTNLSRTLRSLQDKGVWVVGTAGEADHSLYQAKLTGPLALVMGAEGKGMRRLTREHCDELVSIPMAGSVSSLNVSVATGICLFEMVRQRGQ